MSLPMCYGSGRLRGKGKVRGDKQYVVPQMNF